MSTNNLAETNSDSTPKDVKMEPAVASTDTAGTPQPPQKPSKKLKIPKIKSHTIAVMLGLLLAISSIYQINQLTDEQRQYETLIGEISELEALRDQLLLYESLFRSLFYDMWSVDYELYARNESDPTYLMMYPSVPNTLFMSLSARYFTLQSRFMNEFFIKNPNKDLANETDTNPLFILKPEFSWLFETQHNITTIEENWLSDVDLVYEEVAENHSIMQFQFANTMANTSDMLLNYTTFDHINYGIEDWFYFGDTAMMLTMAIPGPINIVFHREPFDEIVNQKITESKNLAAHVDHLSNNLVANGIAVLLISFLVEFTDEERILKWIYLLLAISIGFLSIVGTRAVTTFLGGLF